MTTHDDNPPHVHDENCGHDHGHEQGTPTQESPGVKMANKIIDMANTSLEQGAGVDDIASGLRHAAANFSAFAFFATEQSPKDPNAIVEEFTSFLEHYLDAHKPQESAAQGLMALAEQAKNEL